VLSDTLGFILVKLPFHANLARGFLGHQTEVLGPIETGQDGFGHVEIAWVLGSQTKVHSTGGFVFRIVFGSNDLENQVKLNDLQRDGDAAAGVSVRNRELVELHPVLVHAHTGTHLHVPARRVNEAGDSERSERSEACARLEQETQKSKKLR